MPEAENSAALVLAAGAIVPKNWRAGLAVANDGPSLEDRLADLPPPQLPDEADLNAYMAEMQRAGARRSSAAAEAARRFHVTRQHAYEVWPED